MHLCFIINDVENNLLTFAGTRQIWLHKEIKQNKKIYFTIKCLTTYKSQDVYKKALTKYDVLYICSEISVYNYSLIIVGLHRKVT